jgi:hypothetical protein
LGHGAPGGRRLNLGSFELGAPDPTPKKILRNSPAAEDVVTEEYFEKFFCCTKIFFVRARHLLQWCHGSTAAAIPTVMLDDPGSNPGVNHGCMYLSRRTNVFCLVLSNSVVHRQFGKTPVDVCVYFLKYFQPQKNIYASRRRLIFCLRRNILYLQRS